MHSFLQVAAVVVIIHVHHFIVIIIIAAKQGVVATATIWTNERLHPKAYGPMVQSGATACKGP